MNKRITVLLAGLVLGISSLPSMAAAKKPLDLANADDAFRVMVRFACSETEGRHTLYWWQGKVYSRVEGEPDRLLFKLQGMNMRQCRMYKDPVRGLGYRSVSREVMLYLDPVTNEVARRWKNPWTGKELEVLHVANDPVNLSVRDTGAPRILWSRNEKGEPLPWSDSYLLKDGVILEGGNAARLFYKNPLAGDYQEQVGGWYHAMEFGTQAARASEALDPDDPQIDDAMLSWGRISKWLPWMEMGDRQGILIFHTAGLRLDSWEQIPEVMRDELEKNYAKYREPPPLDDARPNETSWTVFQKYLESRKAPAPGP